MVISNLLTSIWDEKTRNLDAGLRGTSTADEDTKLTGSLPVACDPDGERITHTNTTDPSSGLLSVPADGTYKSTPISNLNGANSFTFTVSDGNGDSNTNTQIITVTDRGKAKSLDSQGVEPIKRRNAIEPVIGHLKAGY